MIIADNRLRRRYRSAKMEILVSKFDAAFKGFGGSFKRLPRAEITPRPFDCSPWMTKTGGEKFYYTGHVSGILNRNFTRFLFDLLLLQRYVRWRKKIRGIQGSGARGENISSRGCTYSKYAGNQYGINIYIYIDRYTESSKVSVLESGITKLSLISSNIKVTLSNNCIGKLILTF